ncbi:olfactory receptor 13F1-like [Discoglossus pictus]
MLFFVAYLITCIANVLVIVIIIFNRHLHKPMYFFLCNLSFVDLSYSSNAVPKLLIDIFSNERIISIGACKFQVYYSLWLGGVECLLLATMAYDRYVAICRPLYYTVLMSWKACYQMTIISWSLCFLLTALPSVSMPVALCYPNTINHFMCESLAVIKLACNSYFLSELAIVICSFIVILLPFIIICVSYICIISSVLKIDSVGRDKAFATCTSHLTVMQKMPLWT